MAKLTLRHVCKEYSGKKVVNDLSFDSDNEFIVIVGPSGCGKTTTLRMIAGLTDVTSGNIEIDGVDVTDTPPGKRNLAMVFQEHTLFSYWNIFDNMAFKLKVDGVEKEETRKRVEEVAYALGIFDELKKKPDALSGGQRQRVALGMAMVSRPKLFLLDEPLSNLDAKLRTEMRALISDLYRMTGTTFVYVTHDQVEAMTMGTKIIVMDRGNARQIASPFDLYNSPADTFVASFMCSPKINLFHGRSGLGQALGLRNMNVGIRPEDFEISDDGVSAKVISVEFLGGEFTVFCETKGQEITVRTKKRVNNGENIFIKVNKMLYFDDNGNLTT